jgi:hypothetical protein
MKNPRSKKMHIFVLVASAFACMTAAHSLAAQTSDARAIINPRALKCLQPANNSTSPGAAIVLEPCDRNNASQLWSAVAAGGNIVRYFNEHSTLCLDARGAAANGTPVQQWTCDSITNENWQYAQNNGAIVPSVISRVSGTGQYCLDVPDGQTDAGVAVQIYACNGTDAQQWYAPQNK